MLSFNVEKSGNVIQIYCDDAGNSQLIDVMNRLLRTSGHIHLHAPPLGNDLSAKSPFGEKAAEEVIITHGGD